MTRHKFRTPDAGAPPKIEVASLIDISFLLLIYFLATSTLVPRENDLGMRLPTIQGNVTSIQQFGPMIISVDHQGTIHTGTGPARQQLDADVASRALPLLNRQLGTYVRAARGAGVTPLVQVHADDAASHQRVVDVLNALSVAGVHHVAFTDLL